MKKNIKVYILLFLITLLAGCLRFYKITKNPVSLNIDEVSFGYSAYSILKTSKDEYGLTMPLTFKSTGDYKNPIPVYLMVPSIWFFGLNELGVRFPTALIGTLSIPAFFFLLRHILKKNWMSLIGAFLIAISPWHIHFSRYAYDPLLASFFLILGILFFLKMIDGKRSYSILSALFFILSMYSAFTLRLFVPMFIFISLVLNYKKIFLYKKSVFIFIFTCLVLVSPLIYLTLFSGANTRLGMIFFTQDIEYTRYVILDHIYRLDEPFMAFFFWIKRYFNYFQPDFLFFNGLNLTAAGTLGSGVLYLFELPFLLLGVIKLIKIKDSWKPTILTWIFLGFLPASLANNETSSGRSLLVLPALLIVITLGVIYAIDLIKLVKILYFRWLVVMATFVFVLINLMQVYLIFAVHFPRQKGEDYMEGTKESIIYAIEHQGEYSEIIYDPFRGIEAPYIVNIPHMYYLFYSKYNPSSYQRIIRETQSGAKIDNFTVRPIDWTKDGNREGVLYIGSPWSLPSENSEHVNVLKKIYLSNGRLALIIVEGK